MKARTSTGILAAVFLILLVLTVRSYLFAPARGAAPARRTSLVESSKKNEISMITLRLNGTGNSVELARKDIGWFLQLDKSLYPANAKKIATFLDELTKERNVITVAKSGTADFAIGRPGSVSVRLQGEDGTIIADIDFGDVNAAGTDIFFRTGRDIAVLQTNDSFTPSLDARTASWAELSPFFALTRKAAIQRASYESAGNENILNAGVNKEQLAAFSSALESLVCIDVASAASDPDERIKIEMGDLVVFSVTFSSRDDGDYSMTDSRSGLTYVVGKWSHDRLVNTFAKQN